MNQAPTYPNNQPQYSYQLDALETPLQSVASPSPMGMDEPLVDVGIEFRHTGWSGNRKCVDAAIAGIPDAENRLSRFRSCGRNSWVLRSSEDPSLFQVRCDKCRDRFCTPCAVERSRHIAACVREWSVDRQIRFVTLTLRKSACSLADDVDRLYAGFARLRRRKVWKRGQKGGIGFIEIKRRRGDDGWHVHLHALTEGAAIDRVALSKAWHQITGDSFIVKVQWCHSSEEAAYYAAKYAGKGVHGSCYHDADVLREALLAIRGRRLVSKWGTWSELDLSPTSDPALWLAVDSLSRLMRRRASGDPEAHAILNALLGERPCDTARSPPVACG